MAQDYETVALVSLLSDAVVARLAAGGYPPLIAGKILLGRQCLAENTSPPRIVMVPSVSHFSSKDVTAALPLLTSTPYTPERLVQLANRSVLTEEFTLEVHCWGTVADRSAPTTVQQFDLNFTRALYHAVIASTDDLARGAWRTEPGRWTEAALVQLGSEFVFGLTFMTPVLTELLPFVPPGTVGQATIVPDGSTGDSVVVPLG